MFVADENRERFSAGLKQLKANATATLRVLRDLEVPPKVNAFRINKVTFQDYFDPEKETDLGYSFFSRASQPFTDGGPQIEYRRVIEKRFRQYLFLSELKPADRSPNLPRLPTPPSLHSDLSWQSWARRMWHEPALVRDPIAGTIYGAKRRISADRVDPAEVASIVIEAANARNGWKVILARCAPIARPRSIAQLVRDLNAQGSATERG